MRTPLQLRALYDQGENISAVMRKERNLDHNSQEIIEVSYDLQTGSYISAMQSPQMLAHKNAYSAEIAARILSVCQPTSILEAGVGEATTLSGVSRSLGKGVKTYGFDLSWSRVAYARQWLNSQGIVDSVLCAGDLFHIPFLENSVDVVYTSHSIEPNGGSEEPILKELFRVARNYVVLLEPGYELASTEAKQRMDSHGYCKNLKAVAVNLGYEVLEHSLFPFVANPLNPTAITIIRKSEAQQSVHTQSILACPQFKTPLKELGGMLYSPEALAVYPVIGGIPCLKKENSIVATKYEEVLQGMNSLHLKAAA